MFDLVNLNLTTRSILASIRQSDIKGMAELAQCGCVKSMSDLQKNLEQKAPGMYALMGSLFVKLQLEIEASKKLLKGGASQFVEEVRNCINQTHARV